MAYMNQEKKAKLAPAIKAVFKKYGLKATIGVRHNSTLVVNIKSSPIDFIGNYNAQAIERNRLNQMDQYQAKDHIDVNVYHIESGYTGKAQECLLSLKQAMMTGNHNRSDTMTDYFDVGWYIDINIGLWDKPYLLA
jgi:hypothetical protein